MRQLIGLLVPLTLSACTADLERKSATRAFDAQAEVVAARGATYISEVQTRRRNANVALVASDPSCRWGPTVWVRDNWSAPKIGGAPSSLCGEMGAVGFHEVRLTSVDATPLAPQLSALVLYQKALADVVSKSPADAQSSLTEAIRTLTAVSGDFSRDRTYKRLYLARGRQTSLMRPPICSMFLIQMRSTHLQVAEVKEIAGRFDAPAYFANLRWSVARLGNLYDENSVARITAALDRVVALEALRKTGEQDEPAVFYNARRDLIEGVAIAQDMRQSPSARVKPLTDAIDALEKLDSSLRENLAGHFSATQRKEISRKNRAQVVDILGKVAAIFPAL